MASPAFSSTLSARGTQLLRAMRLNMELLAELSKTEPGDVAVITAALISHVRSAWPMIALDVPSVEMPVVASPLVSPVEPQHEIERLLHGEHSYRLARGRYDGEELIALAIRDENEGALVYLDDAQAAQLEKDVASVRAAAKGGTSR